VLKAASGKFTPARQWLYFDAVECLPALPADAAAAAAAAADTAPTGSRYDGQIAVFGRAFQQRVLGLRTFLVGAGAIGCEMLKSWAAMGVGCGDGGGVTITDMDRIERSNLSRQFLFRPDDIGKAKSTAGAEAARRMNADMRITAYETRVG
jgi:ubiquitin-activating enzyme E1